MLFDIDKDIEIIKCLQISQEQLFLMNDMYKKTKNYLDKNFYKEIRSGSSDKFHQRWFEMFLILKLLRSNIQLMKPKKKGNQPDICLEIENQYVWIECVTPEPGGGEDGRKIRNALDHADNNDDIENAMDSILSRITACALDKSTQNQQHRKNLINQNTFMILAINISLISPFIRDPFLAIFEGCRDTAVYFSKNDQIEVNSIKCDSILKSENKKLIEINDDFNTEISKNFDFVLFFSCKLGNIINTDESKGMFLNNKKSNININIDKILKILCKPC